MPSSVGSLTDGFFMEDTVSLKISTRTQRSIELESRGLLRETPEINVLPATRVSSKLFASFRTFKPRDSFWGDQVLTDDSPCDEFRLSEDPLQPSEGEVSLTGTHLDSESDSRSSTLLHAGISRRLSPIVRAPTLSDARLGIPAPAATRTSVRLLGPPMPRAMGIGVPFAAAVPGSPDAFEGNTTGRFGGLFGSWQPIVDSFTSRLPGASEKVSSNDSQTCRNSQPSQRRKENNVSSL